MGPGCHRVAIVLTSCCHCAATGLPSCCHRTDIVLPPCCHRVATGLPSCCHRTAIVLPLYCHCVATVLPLCCHRTAIVLPSCCHCAADAFKVDMCSSTVMRLYLVFIIINLRHLRPDCSTMYHPWSHCKIEVVRDTEEPSLAATPDTAATHCSKAPATATVTTHIVTHVAVRTTPHQ